MALEVLQCRDPDDKIDLLTELNSIRPSDEAEHLSPIELLPIPGRPDKPSLVMPRDLRKRSLSTEEGRATLIHAVTHIEFNAINLAVDAAYRFRQQPPAYYDDWLRVAVDEARHFKLLRQRLRDYGYDYGDFPAHNGLWEMAVDTAHDVMIRMALVPRVLEARGLDVTPGMITRLENANDKETADILKIILQEEIPHVAIGTRWFNHHCHLRNLEPSDTFLQLLDAYMRGGVRGPFNDEARLAAGFTDSEMTMLKAKH